MATFNYRCTNEECKEDLETQHSVHDEALKDCPSCKKPTLGRIVLPGTSFRIGGLGVHKPTSYFGH